MATPSSAGQQDRGDDHGPYADMIDWDLAVTTAQRLMRPSPEISADEARDVVAELRRDAASSEEHVRAFTGLHAQSSTAPVLVVDRIGWVQANADGFREILRPLVARLRERRGEPSGVSAAIGSRVTGIEAGGLLAYLSNKVLGQFDPFFTGTAGPDGPSYGGRLLLVAPNIVHVERELSVTPRDFRLWVCLHEETHRVQFTAVPWLREHLLSEMSGLIASADLDPAKIAGLLRDGIESVGRLIKGDPNVSLLDIMQLPEQKQAVERLTAAMSLLEGHADVVMDGVGPSVIPTVAKIRASFTQRRAGAGPVDQMARRLLGFDAKLRQYRDGAAFVRGVVDKVGMDGFNAVWTAPDTLPRKNEIADPAAWVARVHG
ncbi:MAG TPA: zinc-dependent metalloprotease [Nocardioidaceae bacterium]|nr:zinc-dependent metalloprotease [Nocardioidaceae bacterium]